MGALLEEIRVHSTIYILMLFIFIEICIVLFFIYWARTDFYKLVDRVKKLENKEK